MFDEPLFGPYGSSALQYAERLAPAGANAVWFHGFDDSAFAACARHGQHACVEFPTFRADFAQRPELAPIGVDGRPIRYGDLVQGVCLSRVEYLEEIEAALLAGVRAFRPTGVWLDYLTYGGWFETPAPDLQESCLCPACLAEFCESTGLDAASPAETLSRHGERWRRHKRERIAAFAGRYAAIIREHLPDCLVGAYMCPWMPDEFGGALGGIFAQDYALLARHIDVFTPLIYARKCGRPAAWARQFLDAAPSLVPPGRRVQLILDAEDFPASMEETAAAPNPSWGVQLFAGAPVFAGGDASVFRRLTDAIRARLATGH